MNNVEKLKHLQARLKEIEPTITRSFKTSKELNIYYEKNKDLYKEGKKLFDEIQTLQLELMTPKERAEYEENMRLLKLKAERKPLI
ncbi:MAG TPA: hypothetical protein VF677_00390 [Flavobacterium sp.]|jgi:hypothetical protein